MFTLLSSRHDQDVTLLRLRFKTSPQLETVIVVTPWRSVAQLHAHKAWRYSLQRAQCTGVCACVWETEEGGAGIWSRRAFISLWVGSLWGPPQKLCISSIVLFPSFASLLSHVKIQKAAYTPHLYTLTPPLHSYATPFPPSFSIRKAHNPLRLFSKYFITLQCCHRQLEFRQRTGTGKLRLWTSFGIKHYKQT